MREVLSRQVANTLVAAKLETTGSFVFVVDADPKQVDFITIDTHSVLLDISALGGEYCLAVECWGSLTPCLRTPVALRPPAHTCAALAIRRSRP